MKGQIHSMKRALSVFLTAMLLLMSCAVAEDGGMDEPTDHDIEQKLTQTYLSEPDVTYSLNLCFVDGVDDMPWLDLENFCDFMNYFENQQYEDAKFRLEYVADGEKVWLTRETEYYMSVDFDSNTIFFDDYDAFLHDSSEKALVDLVSASGYDADGRGELFQRIPTGSYDRYGDSVLLELDDYGIQLIHQGEFYLVPAQTLSDFILAPATDLNLFYNGEEAFCANLNCFGRVDSEARPLTELGERYYAVEPSDCSEALAVYGYNELCLLLDKQYGLKQLHDVASFDRLFTQLGYKDALMSTDPFIADATLYNFISQNLDDIHSVFSGYSCRTGKRAVERSVGISGEALDDNFGYFQSLRAQRYPDGPAGYEEIGNTAYITLDGFTDNATSTYYAALDDDGILPNDTVGMIIFAHNRIYREDSPIENVVFDLSCNRGGSLNAAAFLLSWVLGAAPVSLQDTFTGATSTAIYRVDTNLDREFDSRDQVDDKHIYCLISPCSFSCGNLVPAAFKASGRVTLLGRTSGGGSCLVQPAATAWGAYFQISGMQRMSYIKNGVYYAIDQGIEPDFVIDKAENFYDREALTNYINGLF